MRASSLLLVLAVAGCGETEGPTETTGRVEALLTKVGGQVQLELVNTTDRTIVSECQALYLEREISGTWQTAWGPACLQPDPPISVTLPPGARRFAQTTSQVPGNYRAVAGYRYEGETVPRLTYSSPLAW